RPATQRVARTSPKLRPVSASLRLRFRSAAFAVARWDFISILLTAKRAKSLFTRAGDGFHAQFFVRALAEILLEQFTIVLTISFSSNRARSSFDPPETALRGRRPGDPGGTGNACAFPLPTSAQFLAPFFVRVPARFIYIRRPPK
ncbi:hypothetical protein, partial [uncultured Rikenella sp.]|uniref:hypothetical protein n=1 Tax=uncultured Rikenella sp. TaxID=368003 RepID=UPI002638DEF2